MSLDISETPEYDFTGVYIAIPCYGMQINYQCVRSLMREMRLLEHLGYNATVEFIGNESHIDRARMCMVASFMGTSDFSHLMFIDSDIEFPEGAILRLLGHTKHNQIGIVGGVYPRKGYPIDYAINVPDEMLSLGTFDGEKIYEADDLATGFMCIHRKVFEKMREHYPDSHVNMAPSQLEAYPKECRDAVNDWYRDFFCSGVFPSKRTGKRLFKSEDYAFCRRWGEMGGRVFFDPTIQLNHIGAHKFNGDVEWLASNIKEKENE